MSIDREHCRSYAEAFSPLRMQESILKYAFPLVKRQAAMKCNGASAWLQKGSRCPVLDSGEQPSVMKKKDRLRRKDIKHYSTAKGIAALNKPGISIAVDRRVALFFQQAILCYNMSAFKFSARGADDQIGCAQAVQLACKSGKSTVHQREAAHSSTIPTLIAHPKDGSKRKGFVYLKGGSSHFQHNTTIGMHACVNGADELVDGNGLDDKLRAKGAKILNQTAKGKLDPVKATQKFIAALDKIVVATYYKLQAEETEDQVDARKLVLKQYHRKLKKIKLAAEEEVFYDRLVGVVIGSGLKGKSELRKVLYQRRYDVIRLQEVIESRIGKRIERIKNKMAAGESGFIEHILLVEFADSDQQAVIEKLFGKTACFFEEEYLDDCAEGKTQALKAFKTRVKNLQKDHSKEIKRLRKKLCKDFTELSCAEFSFRAAVFRDLRKQINGWSKRTFCKRYLQANGQEVSPSWVSHIEALAKTNIVGPNCRLLSSRKAMLSAAAFAVDAGIFFPQLFVSEDPS